MSVLLLVAEVWTGVRHSQCVSLTPPRALLKLSLLRSIVFHKLLNRHDTRVRDAKCTSAECPCLRPPRRSPRKPRESSYGHTDDWENDYVRKRGKVGTEVEEATAVTRRGEPFSLML